jgi:hypothetical protein
VDTKCRRAGLRRNEIASSLAAACREQKIEINSAIRVLSLHYFCFLFACLPCALHMLLSRWMKGSKMVRVWCMEKLLCSQLVPGTNKQFLGLVLTASRTKAAGTCQISHTGQAPARVVWKTFACSYLALQAPCMHCNRICIA